MKMKTVNEAKTLKALRKGHNISQIKLGAELGYRSQQLISNVERGLCGVPPRKFKKLVQLYGVEFVERIIAAKMDDYRVYLLKCAGKK